MPETKPEPDLEEESQFSFKRVLLHIDASTTLKAAFEEIRELAPKGINSVQWLIVKKAIENSRGRYYAELERMVNEDIPERENIEKNFLALKEADKEEVITPFYEKCIGVLQSKDRQLSVALEYCGFNAFVNEYYQRKLDEFYSTSIEATLTKEKMDNLAENIAKVSVLAEETGINIGLLEQKIAVEKKKMLEQTAEMEAYKLTTEERYKFVRKVKIYETVEQLHKSLKRFPSQKEILNNCGIKYDDARRLLSELWEEKCVKIHGWGKRRKFYEPVQKPRASENPIQEESKQLPKSAPQRENEHSNEQIQEKKAVNVQKTPMTVQTEGVMEAEKYDEEDTDDANNAAE